jgi:glycosyltransferase involved in cell wall biosynthesis
MEDLALSVVIPCKNEESFLSLTLKALSREKEKFTYISEIILVDNFSTDKSIKIAEEYDVKIYSCGGNISTVRNFGANKSNGNILCFVDADVEIKSRWSKAIIDCINEENGNQENCIFGNIYNLPLNATWVEKTWYTSLINRRKIEYINGGNLIIHRTLFEKLLGFSNRTITGEDVDLCKRAVRMNVTINNDNRIQSIHHGYPKSILDFFNRERWHGLGAINYTTEAYKSRSFLLAILTLISPILILILIYFTGIKPVTILLTTVFFVSLIACSIRMKSFFSWEPIKLNLLFIIYSLARAQAIVDMISARNITIKSSGRKKPRR